MSSPYSPFYPADASAGGPSRPRPIPTRTLHQPHSLTVAQRDDAGHLNPGAMSDAAAYQVAMRNKIELRRKGDKWADRLSEGVASAEDLKKGSRYLEPHHYLSLAHERHLTSLCSYPLCSHPPRAKWNPHQSMRISMRKGSIEDTTGQGNAHEGYCSAWCEARGKHVQRQLEAGGGVWLRGKGWGVELLEEVVVVKPAGEQVNGRVEHVQGAGQGQQRRSRPSSDLNASATAAAGSQGEGGRTITSRGTVNGNSAKPSTSEAAAAPSEAAAQDDRTPADRISAIQIRERPTAPNPIAPSLTGPRPSDVRATASAASGAASGTSAGSTSTPTASSSSSSTHAHAAAWTSSSPNRPILARNPAQPQRASDSGTSSLSQRSPSAAQGRPSSATGPPLPTRSARGPPAVAAAAADRRAYGLAPPTALTGEIMAASKLGSIGARIAQAEQAGTFLRSSAALYQVADTSTGNGLREDEDFGTSTNPESGGSTGGSGKRTGKDRQEGEDTLEKAVRVPDWVAEMSFGPEDEDEDVQALFEQMRLGQEIMRGQDEV